MENQIQKKDFQEMRLIQSLLGSLTITGSIDTNKLDRFQISKELKLFKTEHGQINYPKLFDIPNAERLPEIAKKDVGTAVKLFAVGITMAMETMNLTRPMNSMQIVDLAEEITDSLNEGDNLAIEDFMLFLQKLTRGEFGAIYEGIDKMKFMGFFSQYRDERWNKAKDLYYERHQGYKDMGNSKRERSTSDNPLDVHMHEMSSKVQSLKDQLKEQKDLNKRIRDDF